MLGNRLLIVGGFVVSLVIVGLVIQLSLLKSEVEKLTSDVEKYKTAYLIQKKEADKAVLVLNDMSKKYKDAEKRYLDMQSIYVDSIKKYRKMLEECKSKRYKQPVIIVKKVISDKCPKINVKSSGKIVKQLNSLF